MYPRSTAKLNPGDFCLLERDDGLSVPLVFIRSRRKARSYFFGGVVDAVVRSDVELVRMHDLRITNHALLHVHCFEKNQTPILGNIREKLCDAQFEELYEGVVSTGIGHKTNVWGHRTPYKYAERVAAEVSDA